MDLTKKQPSMVTVFTGEFRFLSNFYPAPILYENKLYPTSEHLYHALKTMDLAARDVIRLADTSFKAKKLGRKVVLRADWEEVKLEIMELVLRAKFSQSISLFRSLLHTGTGELIEGNWWGDRYWGVDKKSGEGENHLGKLLMKIRDDFRDELESSGINFATDRISVWSVLLLRLQNDLKSSG